MKTSLAGFSLTEIMIAMGISAVVAIGAGGLFYDMQREQAASASEYWLEQRRTELLNYLVHDNNWNEILSANSPNMDCFSSTSGCQGFPVTNTDLKLNMYGTEAIDGTNPNLGLDKEGKICYSFDPVNGNNACPYGMKMTWRLVCESATNCTNPEAKITVQFAMNGGKGMVNRNLSRLAIGIQRAQNMNTQAQVCNNMGGTYVGSKCDLSSVVSDCDFNNGFYLTGFNAAGKPICSQISFTPCAANQHFTGIDPVTGDSICSAGCP